MTDLLALITVIIWPAVPLFWIPVHGLSRVFKKLGLWTYIMPVVTWVPLAYLLYINRAFFLPFKADLSIILNIAGFILLTSGTALHIWTGRLLGLRGLIGIPEIYTKAGGAMITKGAFSVVRHPTYLAHTLMFGGIFLITGAITVGIITVLDLITINAVVIPLEDKELISRFGGEYKEYKKRVPGFFPHVRS